MTSLRKHAVAWFLALTTVALSTLAGAFLYLTQEIPVDSALIETRTAQVALKRGFDIDGARKHYTEEEITVFLVKANQADFQQQWSRLLISVNSATCLFAISPKNTRLVIHNE
jgi:methionine-rich copper-binding protein CopC